MRISDWSSDVCSSDLIIRKRIGRDESEERTLGFSLSSRTPFKELTVQAAVPGEERWWSISGQPISNEFGNFQGFRGSGTDLTDQKRSEREINQLARYDTLTGLANRRHITDLLERALKSHSRSEEHTSELQSLMRISYAVFCLNKKNIH